MPVLDGHGAGTVPFISPATAKTHVAHLLTKLRARDRVQLVIIAYQAGLAAAAP